MRILQEKDRDKILQYVNKEPEMNLFITGDIENYGVQSEEINVYLHEERDRWDFIILRYYNFFILYSQFEDYNAAEAIEFLKHQKTECISGKTNLLEKIAPAFKPWTIQNTYMSRCNQVKKAFKINDDVSIRLLRQEDVPAAIDLLMSIEEFKKTYEGSSRSEYIERMQKNIADGSKVAVGAFLSNELVAIAETSADNSVSAMVVGVAAAKQHRRKGYASAVVTALCENCFSRGKQFLCLFYDNPNAGRIYNKIGFEEIGLYGMLR